MHVNLGQTNDRIAMELGYHRLQGALQSMMTSSNVNIFCVAGIRRSPVNSQHKGQWRGALMLSLICAWINGWVNNGDAADLRRHGVHYDVNVMIDHALESSVRTVRVIISRYREDCSRSERPWANSARPGVWVTKAPFVNFSVSEIFDIAKVHVRFSKSHLYFTDVAAA